jgi:hypothetical protein
MRGLELDLRDYFVSSSNAPIAAQEESALLEALSPNACQKRGDK